MEGLTESQEKHVREIVRQEINAALASISSEFDGSKLAGTVTGPQLSRAVEDAALLYLRRSA